ncbi:hypothetical protein ACJJTC_005815 [Scirpophaga incertulas]
MITVDLLSDIDDSLNIKCHKVEYAEQCNALMSKFKLKILTVNIRSLQCHINEFLVILDRINLDFDILVLTECWLRDSPMLPNIDGFNAYSSSKYINKSGGVVIYVKSCWNPLISEPNLSDANCLAVHIPGLATVLGVYRSPSFRNLDSFLNSLETVISDMPKSPCQILTGDININILEDSVGSDYLCVLAQLGYIQAVDKPTRNDACLDHFFVKTALIAESVVCNSVVADHNLVLLGVNQDLPGNREERKTRTHLDCSGIFGEVATLDWSPILVESSINYVNNFFSSIGEKLADVHLNNKKKSQNSLASKVKFQDSPRNSFFMSPITDYEVDSLIHGLKSNSAPVGREGEEFPND